ncbi:MAG: hypothetical protein HY079_01985 [Elusimicrobia bacterium]|nr:hypothetical protein [Elusimicrobiota bacterium]
MSDNDTLKIAAALAAEFNARQSADYEPRPAKGGAAEVVLASKSGAGRPAGLIVLRPAVDAAAQAAADAVAQKLAAKLKGRTGALALHASRAPSAADADAWADAAAAAVAALEKAGGKAGAEFLTLDEPPSGSPFGYASWAPQARPEGLLVEVFYRSGAAQAAPKTSGAEDHWLVLLGEPSAPGKAVGRAFALDLPEGDAVCRAWWAAPKGGGWTFRRF